MLLVILSSGSITDLGKEVLHLSNIMLINFRIGHKLYI